MLKIVCLLSILSSAAWGHYRADNPVRVIETGSCPTWSPDGRRLAFCARPGEFTQIFIFNIETAEVTQLTDCIGHCDDPTWKPDGALIAFSRYVPSEFSQLMSIHADGEAQRELTPAETGARASQPAWSPTTDEIAHSTNRFGASGAVAVLDLTTGDIRKVADSELSLERPAWAPDGKRLVCWNEGYFDGVEEGRLYEIDPSSVQPPIVLMRDPGGFRDPSWIDGGNSVLYRALRSSVNRLFVQNLGRLEPREIGPVTMGRIRPALSPDGTTLAFVGQGGIENRDTTAPSLLRPLGSLQQQVPSLVLRHVVCCCWSPSFRRRVACVGGGKCPVIERMDQVHASIRPDDLGNGSAPDRCVAGLWRFAGVGSARESPRLLPIQVGLDANSPKALSGTDTLTTRGFPVRGSREEVITYA